VKHHLDKVYIEKENKKIKLKRKLLVHLLCVSAFNYDEVMYRPGNSGFTQTQTHFNSLDNKYALYDLNKL
jgi:hypothetical protein